MGHGIQHSESGRVRSEISPGPRNPCLHLLLNPRLNYFLRGLIPTSAPPTVVLVVGVAMFILKRPTVDPFRRS